MAKVSADIIGRQLREFRGERSLREAASELGVSHQTINLCEKGMMLPSLNLLIAAMDKWNVTFLLNGYQVVPTDLMRARAAKPQPIQGVLPRLRPRSFKAKSVRIRQRENEIIITAIARINSSRH